AGGVLPERDRLEQVPAPDDRPADHVGVAAEVLGRAVDDQVGPQRQRLLQVRGGEGGVGGGVRPAAGGEGGGRGGGAGFEGGGWRRRRCRGLAGAGWSATRPRRASSRG